MLRPEVTRTGAVGTVLRAGGGVCRAERHGSDEFQRVGSTTQRGTGMRRAGDGQMCRFQLRLLRPVHLD